MKNKYFMVGDSNCKIKCIIDFDTYNLYTRLYGIFWFDEKFGGYGVEVPKKIIDKYIKEMFKTTEEC